MCQRFNNNIKQKKQQENKVHQDKYIAFCFKMNKDTRKNNIKNVFMLIYMRFRNISFWSDLFFLLLK